MQKRKIGILGCGGIARNAHLPAYMRLSEIAEVVAACDLRVEALNAVKEKFNIPKLYSNVEALCNDTEVEIVTICTPPTVREEVILPLIESGKHLLVEKPFTLRLPEAIRIVQAAEKRGVKLAVNQNFRWKETTKKAKEIIASGEVGEPIFLGETFFVWRDEKGGWRHTINQLEISVYSIHLIDRIRWLASKDAISAHCATLTSQRLSSKGESLSCITITFEDGSIGHVNSSWCARGLRQNYFRVDGTEGSIFTDGDFQLQVFTAKSNQSGESKSFQFQADFTNTFAESMRLLIEAVNSNSELSISGRDNLKTMALVDGAYTSAEMRQAISLSSFNILIAK